MRYRRLGTSGLEVSVIAFGAWQIGDSRYWGAAEDADGIRAVHAAIDAGVNLFDTAESYGQGESERALGKALGARRGQVFVATKVSAEHCRPGGFRKACEGSLERLGTDHIDLYQIHWPFHDVPFAQAWEELEALRSEEEIPVQPRSR